MFLLVTISGLPVLYVQGARNSTTLQPPQGYYHGNAGDALAPDSDYGCAWPDYDWNQVTAVLVALDQAFLDTSTYVDEMHLCLQHAKTGMVWHDS